MGLQRTALRSLMALCAGVLVAGATAQAADYPTKQIEMIVPYAAGGGTDLVARAFADTAKKYLPQPIGVINKTGGAGAVGLSEIVTSRPNGYKIGLGTAELAMLPHMGLVQFTAGDFVPVARLNADPAAITVKIDAPWNTYEDFIAYAKTNPGKIRIGNSGTGAIWHLAAAALEDKTSVKFNHIPYDGANPAVTALLGGHIEAVTVSPAEVISHVAAGKLKVLAIMTDKRLPKFPDVPTLKERGVDLSIGTWRGIVAPKGTPQDVVDILRAAAKKTSEDTAFKEALDKMNLNQAPLDAPEFKEAITKDNALFKELMTKVGIAK